MCDKKQRFMDRNNITTIKAHRLFNHWQQRAKMLRRGKAKTIDEFCKSPFFKAFNRLAEFTSSEYVVSGFKYIDWLVENKIPEVKWCNPRDLDDYRAYLRASEEPESQAKTSCKNIRVWCVDNDITMPEFSGFYVVDKLVSVDQLKNNKILFFTAASVTDSELEKWYKLGVKGCLRKPVDPNTLFEKINEAKHTP